MDTQLLRLLRATVPDGTTIATVSAGKPNLVERIDHEGVWIETERSTQSDGPVLVRAWMVNEGWRELRRSAALEARDLVRTVKRSSAVCALLAQLPGVCVTSTRPIRLVLEDRP